MTVKELKAALENIPDDLQVVLSKDAEGNDFSPLADVTPGYYEPTTTWYGDFTTDNWQDGKVTLTMPNAVCLGPVN